MPTGETDAKVTHLDFKALADIESQINVLPKGRGLRDLKFSVVFIDCRKCGMKTVSWVEQVNLELL
jgi:hypothetical protein